MEEVVEKARSIRGKARLLHFLPLFLLFVSFVCGWTKGIANLDQQYEENFMWFSIPVEIVSFRLEFIHLLNHVELAQ